MWFSLSLSRFRREAFILIALFDILLSDVAVSDQSEIDKHLELGKKLLAAGQLADALSHYHAAVELDPKNYQIYFRRATVYMGIGKSKSALPDLDRVIELKPDFSAAYQQRGSILLKSGRLSEAKADLRRALELDPDNMEAKKQAELINPLAEDVENAKNLFDNGMYSEAIEFLTKALEISPFDVDLRLQRADAYEAVGEGFKAASDLRSVNRLTNDNTIGFLRVSQLLYRLGDPEQSLKEIRECLKLDPDHKECFKHYKNVKKVFKAYEAMQREIEAKQWDNCLQKLQKLQKLAKDSTGMERQIQINRCLCASKNGEADAVDICSNLLESDPNNLDALCNRADAYINQEMLEEAIKDYQQVLEVDKTHQRAKEGVARAQKLLKSSRRRNYYQILGVPRTARKRDILKAYRKLAAQYHPDHFKGEDKNLAKKKFIDISDAKDVLTDEEKRAKFDNGQDPLDHEQQQQHQGFNPFGGGGFSFQNFNPFEGHDGHAGGGGGEHFEFFFG